MNHHFRDGVIYDLTGDNGRGEIANYHRKPSPLFLNKSKHKIDVSGLKIATQRTAVKFDGAEYVSKYTIGIEVEKNSLHRGAVKEYALFCGFERDGSCGYEAVSHILPLLPSGLWRTKVYNMFHQAERIIDDRFSPSNLTCGGHISVGVDGISGKGLNLLMRRNCGVVLALFKKRLNTKYCGSNRRMQDSNLDSNDGNYNSWSQCGDYRPTQRHSKYQTALPKDECLEFRVPSRFQSVKQVMRRYELFYTLVDFSITKPRGTHKQLMKLVRPIILSMYDGNVVKTDKVIERAEHFRNFIMKGKIDPSISEFLK